MPSRMDDSSDGAERGASVVADFLGRSLDWQANDQIPKV